MLSVTIPRDLISARVKTDFKEMELNAQYWQRVSYRLNRRRHKTSKIVGCSASEHCSKIFDVLIVLFDFFSSFIQRKYGLLSFAREKKAP